MKQENVYFTKIHISCSLKINHINAISSPNQDKVILNAPSCEVINEKEKQTKVQGKCSKLRDDNLPSPEGKFESKLTCDKASKLQGMTSISLFFSLSHTH